MTDSDDRVYRETEPAPIGQVPVVADGVSYRTLDEALDATVFVTCEACEGSRVGPDGAICGACGGSGRSDEETAGGLDEVRPEPPFTKTTPEETFEAVKVIATTLVPKQTFTMEEIEAASRPIDREALRAAELRERYPETEWATTPEEEREFVQKLTELVATNEGLDEVRPEPPFTITMPAEALEELEELAADGLRPCGCADGCPACDGTRLIATNDRGRAILAGADPDDCPTCGGSGGGPDAALRCTACRGTGRRPEEGPWSI